MIGGDQRLGVRASTDSPFFEVEEFSGVSRRACTTLPGGAKEP
jgi:hypothetical protein